MLAIQLTTPYTTDDTDHTYLVPCGEDNTGISNGVLAKAGKASFWHDQNHFLAAMVAAQGQLDVAIQQHQVPVLEIQFPPEYLHAIYEVGLPPGSPLTLPAPPNTWGGNMRNMLWVLITAPSLSQWAGTIVTVPGS
jgi:hypothetical protein